VCAITTAMPTTIERQFSEALYPWLWHWAHGGDAHALQLLHQLGPVLIAEDPAESGHREQKP
jgi:hypothetical protein